MNNENICDGIRVSIMCTNKFLCKGPYEYYFLFTDIVKMTHEPKKLSLIIEFSDNRDNQLIENVGDIHFCSVFNR